MKIWTISDLHLGQAAFEDMQSIWKGPAPDADLAIVPGDVVENVDLAADWLGRHVRPHMPVVWLLGNHEFYHGDFARSRQWAREASKRHDLILLDDDEVVVDGVRILGSTLWTDYGLYDPAGDMGIRARYMDKAKRSMLDHRLIRVDGRTFVPDDAMMQHFKSLAWLRIELAKPFPGETVVVTHHAPHPRSVHAAFEDDPVTPAFVSDLSTTIEEFQPALWIHGHTHAVFDYTVGATRIVCNPRGYRHERGNGFRPDLVLEVGGATP